MESNSGKPDFNWVQIYCLTSPSGKKYIGQTKKYLSGGKPRGIETRWKQHVNDARLYQKGRKESVCRYLCNAINKHGSDNFTIEMLLECKVEVASFYESYYMSEYNTLDPNHGYNIIEASPRTNYERTCSNFAENQQKMIDARRVIKYVDMTSEEETTLQVKLKHALQLYPPGHNSKNKRLPMYLRSFTCSRGYPGYKVEIKGYPIKTIRSGFTRNLNHALDEALDYLKECMKDKANDDKNTFSETTEDGSESLANSSKT